MWCRWSNMVNLITVECSGALAASFNTFAVIRCCNIAFSCSIMQRWIWLVLSALHLLPPSANNFITVYEFVKNFLFSLSHLDTKVFLFLFSLVERLVGFILLASDICVQSTNIIVTFLWCSLLELYELRLVKLWLVWMYGPVIATYYLCCQCFCVYAFVLKDSEWT